MKTLFFVLFAVVGVSLASSTLTGPIEGHCTITWPQTEDQIDSNVFNEGDMYTTAFASFGDYYSADDFTPGADYCITDVTWWTVTNATSPTTGVLDVNFYDDAAPGPAQAATSPVWAGTATNVQLTDTGVTFAGFPIYMTHCTLPDTDYFTAYGGTTYWTAMWRNDASAEYIILDSIVEGTEMYRVVDAGGAWVAGSTTGYPATDCFQLIEGTATGLDSETWGSIKSIF